MMVENKPVLEVENLKMHFSSGKGKNKFITKAVDDVSFKIYEGETFGLVGESGCGKTTTGRTIVRLYDPTGGNVYFKGKIISGKMSKQLKKEITSEISMIFQDPVASLNPRMTVEEIVGEGLKVMGIRDVEERRKLVANMLQEVGLTEEHMTRYPHEFSGGQRQRIGIARALIIGPSLVIADEPLSALDVSIQAQVINLLNELKDALGLTILFIAHDLSVVKYFSDRIGVMYNGKLLEIAESDELYKNPIHPYTKSLLSAIPEPNPITEKNRKREFYDPNIHNYTKEKPELHEVKPGHYIYASKTEVEEWTINI